MLIKFISCLVEIGFASSNTRVNENVGTASIPVVASPPSMQQLTITAESSVGSSATGMVKKIVHNFKRLAITITTL